MTISKRHHLNALLGLLAGVLALSAAGDSRGAAPPHVPPAPAEPVADATARLDDPAFVAQVHQSVEAASQFLLREFMPPEPGKKDHFLKTDHCLVRNKISMSLALWALDEVGVHHDKDPALQRGYAWLVAQPREARETFPVIANALRVIALCAVKDRPAELQKCLEQDVHWLLETAATPQGYSYPPPAVPPPVGTLARRNAIECSYWVIRAMDAASKQGVTVPESFWPKMLQITWDNRAPTGGWQPWRGEGGVGRDDDLQTQRARDQITPGNQWYNVTFPTTVAGICSMEMCLAHLRQADLASANGRAMAQGLQDEIHWIDSRVELPSTPTGSYLGLASAAVEGFLAMGAPDRGGNLNCGAVSWPAMVGQLRQITGQKSWGKVDPYRPLAKAAIDEQHALATTGISDGGYGYAGVSDPQAAASVILFLTSEPAVYPPPVATTQSASTEPAAPSSAAKLR